jgi:hypothetical protein
VANYIGFSFVTITLALNRNGAGTMSVGKLDSEVKWACSEFRDMVQYHYPTTPLVI